MLRMMTATQVRLQMEAWRNKRQRASLIDRGTRRRRPTAALAAAVPVMGRTGRP